jgi:hypothetical protein
MSVIFIVLDSIFNSEKYSISTISSVRLVLWTKPGAVYVSLAANMY